MIKLYPSSSAFACGDAVFTRYNSGCLRKILLNKHGIREELKSTTQQLGADNEEAYEQTLKATLPYPTTYTREEPIKSVLDNSTTDPIIFSGRADFVLRNGDVVERVDELKSTQSANKRRELRAGEISPENLAQLVAYMVELETHAGRLLYTFYDLKKNIKENYDFSVNIAANGTIELNRCKYEFSVHDYLRHRELACDVLRRDVIGPRPYGGERPFVGACGFCPFKDRCAKADAGCSVSEFTKQGV